MLSSEQIQVLEKEAELNNGKCGTCYQTIKIYRYRLNKIHAQFMRAMAEEVRNTGVNDVDLATIGLAYSVRTQVTKLRLHGLIARITDKEGKQIARRWLITKKGFAFLNNKAVFSIVIVFNNQVLGHDNPHTRISELLGERFNAEAPLYEETPVSEPEARVYKDVRTPQKYMVVSAKFKGRDYLGRFKVSQVYELQIKRLVGGQPVEITAIDSKTHSKTYKDIAAFARDWKVL